MEIEEERSGKRLDNSLDKESGKCHVLVVDDNEDFLNLHNMVLTLKGAHVATACDGKKGLDAFCRSPGQFDLAIIDIQMPRMDGFELVAALRAMNTTAVLIASSSMGGIRDRCIATGFDDYYEKPVSPKDIESILKKYNLLPR